MAVLGTMVMAERRAMAWWHRLLRSMGLEVHILGLFFPWTETVRGADHLSPLRDLALSTLIEVAR